MPPPPPPLPHPFLTIPHLSNTRDASYNLSTPSGPLRPGILFRSAEITHCDVKSFEALAAYGVRTVFDLRSAPEVQRGWAGVVERGGGGEKGSGDEKPRWLRDMQGTGVRRVWVPVFAEQDYSPEKLAVRYVKYMSDGGSSGFVDAYRDILTAGAGAFGTIFRHLADMKNKGEAILVHCSAGKDRTGVFFAVLFAFLGVGKREIANEYQLTEVGLAHLKEEVVEKLLQSSALRMFIRKQEGLEDEDGEGDAELNGVALEKAREAALRMVGAKAASMMATLDMLDGEWGGAEAYMRMQCGLREEELTGLRNNLMGGW